jgi:hypothetical protein
VAPARVLNSSQVFRHFRSRNTADDPAAPE